MGRIILSICAVVVAVGLAGSSPPNQGAAEQERHAENPQQKAAPPEAAPEAQGSDHLYATCEQGEADRKSDLCAQWYAADSAKTSAVWTRWTGIFTGIGLILGSATVAAAVAAALYARKAANHTSDAVKDMRAQTRAHLRIENVYGNLIGVADRPDMQQGLCLSVEMVNAGNTRASSVTVVVGAEYDGVAFPSLTLEDTGDPGDGVIPEGATVFWRAAVPDLIFDLEVMGAGGYSNKLLTAHVHVSYIDIYGERHSIPIECVGHVWARQHLRDDRTRYVNAILKPVT